MAVSLAPDLDFAMTTEAFAPRWRQETWLGSVHVRASAKQPLQFAVQLPAGTILVELSGEAGEPRWFRPVLKAVSDLGSLPNNWNSYGARPVAIEAVVNVLKLLSLIMTDAIPLPALVPMSNGGIQVEWHTRGIDLEIEVTPAGGRRAALEDSNRNVEWASDATSNLSPLREALKTLAGDN
jgi:hypothetical protein